MSETLNPAAPAQIKRDDSKAKGMSMDKIRGFSPVVSVLSFPVLVLAVLFGLVYFLLDAKIDPLKKDIAKIEIRMDGFDNELKELKEGQAKLEEGQAKLEEGQVKLEKRMDKLEEGQAKILTILEKIKSQSSKK